MNANFELARGGRCCRRCRTRIKERYEFLCDVNLRRVKREYQTRAVQLGGIEDQSVTFLRRKILKCFPDLLTYRPHDLRLTAGGTCLSIFLLTFDGQLKI